MQRSKLKFTVNETVKFSKSSFSCNGAVPPPSTKFGSVKGTSKDYDEGIVEVCVFTSFLCYIYLIESDTFGGIIFNGQLAWIANDSQIEIVSLKTGFKVSSYKFNNAL